MNLEQVQKLFSSEVVKETLVGLNLLDFLSTKWFNSKSVAGMEYREKALDEAIELKKPFRSTFNLVHNVAQRFIQVKCPYCPGGWLMDVVQGGGNATHHTVNYRCSGCFSRINLTLPCDGIGVDPLT